MAKAKPIQVRKMIEASRSSKARRPPETRAVPTRVRRRQKTARAEFRKDTRGPASSGFVTKPKIKKG